MKKIQVLSILLWPGLLFAGTSNDVEGQFLYAFIGVLLALFLLYRPVVKIGRLMLQKLQLVFKQLKQQIAERFRDTFELRAGDLTF